VRAALDPGERLMGFGHRVYRAHDPRARTLRRTARELGSARARASPSGWKGWEAYVGWRDGAVRAQSGSNYPAP
jgi:Citrate synthase, C-terminal domain